ncbi:Relaxase/Mobilisation nuclease domain-containing protein [Paracoccus alcaliphilus]|uniref:Relaxase/Mobilisation nuclease domain-containing protein n=1 Tax=Paracoccus alcaliphilus TaxID=34002 RepID=A0A1H8LRD8_9RHOB|nr:Relaxase/Mobilisation nuclease domain-containing protein [Paracoccus alcaliphilus]
MIAKVVIRRRSARARKDPFRARVDYICRKANTVNVGNLAGGWQDASWQMTVTAGLAPRIRQPAYHIILSWPDTESPTDQDMLNAARMVLAELGAEEHQYILAVHRDRRNGHVHILINRVHPITGAGLSTSHDFARLELACRRIECDMGWAADRGRFAAVKADGSVQLVRKPASHWQERRRQRAAGLRPDGQAGTPFMDVVAASHCLRNGVIRWSCRRSVHARRRLQPWLDERHRRRAREGCRSYKASAAHSRCF